MNLTDELMIYDSIHRSRINRLLHAVGIPTIVFAVTGLFGLLRLPALPVVNAAIPLAIVTTVVVWQLDRVAAVAFAALSIGLLALGQLTIGELGNARAAMLFAVAFVVGWAIQFTGHVFEDKSPQFVARPLNLLLGPLSVLNDMLPLVRPAPWRR